MLIVSRPERRIKMFRKTVLLTVCLLFVSGLALSAGKKTPTKIATGTIKTLDEDSLTIQQGSVEFSFVVTDDTKVKGNKKKGEEKAFTDLLHVDQRVMVRYHDEDGELQADEVKIMP
jgi:hypothetical protein